ncbi:MAG TPA: type VI secretion system baseplate subunit TssK [Telluria sp.]|jgi:type VI secretion system protein ImpJ
MAEALLFDRIRWHEGMLLTPQQFQQESSRVDALVGWQALAGQPCAWGVRRLVIDEAALTCGVLRISLVEAILPNGMAVWYDAGQAQGATLELDLGPHGAAMEQHDLPVYLATGCARSLRLAGQPAMFRGIQGNLVEDEVSEALPDEVPRMAPNLVLIAGPAPGAAYTHLHLMSLRKENEIVRRTAFWPAQLAVPSDAPLRQRAHSLAALMRNKAVFLGRQTASGSSRVEDRLAMLEQKARLSSLTLNLPVLDAVLQLEVVQPQALYLALCAQLGPLAALRPGAVPMAPPPYLHGNSQGAFEAVLRDLEALVGEVSQEWKSVIFNFDGQVFALPMRPEWLGARLVVGLRGNGEGDPVAWMAGAAIGSRTVSVWLNDCRTLGAERAKIDGASELGLRGSPGCTLYAIEVSPESIVADQDLLISNIHEHVQALRPQEIVLFIKG